MAGNKIKMTIIKHDDIKSPNFRKNNDWTLDHGGTPCCICGKAINEDKKSKLEMLHWFDGGDLLTDYPDEFPKELQERDKRFEACADLNFYPVGPDCYKKWMQMKNTNKYEEDV